MKRRSDEDADEGQRRDAAGDMTQIKKSLDTMLGGTVVSHNKIESSFFCSTIFFYLCLICDGATSAFLLLSWDGGCEWLTPKITAGIRRFGEEVGGTRGG